MKKFMIGIAALMLGAGATQAAFEVTLDELSAGTVSSATFVYGNLSATPGVATFDGGALSVATAVTDDTISGATGSLEITWTATEITSPFVGENWGPIVAAPLYSYANGLGIISAGQTAGARQFQGGESYLLTVNTNNLMLNSGKVLIFSARPTDGDGFNVYQRTGTSNGVMIATLPALTPAPFSPIAIITPSDVENGMLEFAISDFTGAGRMLDFKIDVIDTVEGVAQPTGLHGVALDAGAYLAWDSDGTGFLDYYTVYRSEVSGTNNYEAVTNVITPEFIDSGLTNDIAYYYAVTAYGASGTPIESAYSDELTITPIAITNDTVFLMHYDASQTNSVTIGTNGFVSVWANLVSPGTYDATETWEGFVYPSTNLSATGLKGVDCTTNPAEFALMDVLESDILLDTTGGKSGFVVLMAVRPEGAGTQQDIIGNSSFTDFGFGIRWTGTGFQTWLAGSDSLSTVATNGDTVVVSYRFDAADRECTVWESAGGNSLTVPRLPFDYSLDSDGINLGRIFGDTRNFNGQIFEVKVWGSTLDDATLKAEQVAMTQKWAGNGYDIWARQFGDIGAENEDDDNDGISNINEFGLGGNPTNNAVAPAVLPTILATESGLEYVHVMNNEALGLVYDVETTTDLVNPDWTNNGYVTPVSITASDNEMLDTVTNTVDSSVESELFIRLKIQ